MWSNDAVSRGPRTTPGGARIAFVTWRGELELIEPTLFFHADPSAPARFAQALRA